MSVRLDRVLRISRRPASWLMIDPPSKGPVEDARFSRRPSTNIRCAFERFEPHRAAFRFHREERDREAGFMRLPSALSALLSLGLVATAFAQQTAEIRSAEPRPTPSISEGNAGLAAKYPGDVGIEKDPDVVFVETFDGSVDEVCGRWDQAAGREIMTKSDEVPAGSGLKQ